MRILYTGSALIGVTGIITGLAMTKVKSALDAWWALSSIFSGGMLGLFLLGYLSKKATNVHAFAGVLAGIVVISWITFSPEYFPSTLHTNMAIVLGTTSIFVVGFALVALSTKKSTA
jgi:SSS family solute:Na+ symporter